MRPARAVIVRDGDGRVGFVPLPAGRRFDCNRVCTGRRFGSLCGLLRRFGSRRLRGLLRRFDSRRLRGLLGWLDGRRFGGLLRRFSRRLLGRLDSWFFRRLLNGFLRFFLRRGFGKPLGTRLQRRGDCADNRQQQHGQHADQQHPLEKAARIRQFQIHCGHHR